MRYNKVRKVTGMLLSPDQEQCHINQSVLNASAADSEIVRILEPIQSAKL